MLIKAVLIIINTLIRNLCEALKSGKLEITASQTVPGIGLQP